MSVVVETVRVSPEERAAGLRLLESLLGVPDPEMLRLVEERAGIERSAEPDAP